MTKSELVRKRLELLEKREHRWVENSLKADGGSWYSRLTGKIPKSVESKLQLAFYKGFELLFVKGSGLLGRAYRKESFSQDFSIRDYAFEVKGTGKSLKNVSGQARRSQLINTGVTLAEGLGLGLIGLGIPDIPIFLSMLLKGVYEIASSFGVSYDSQKEKYFILLLLETAVLRGQSRISANQKTDDFMNGLLRGNTEAFDFQAQLKATADAYATDTLFLKFIQGAPIIGAVGGIYNPVYYRRVSDYAALKYEKRYLLQKSIDLKNCS